MDFLQLVTAALSLLSTIVMDGAGTVLYPRLMLCLADKYGNGSVFMFI